MTKGFETRSAPVRDVRIEPDPDTKQPRVIVQTNAGIEWFDFTGGGAHAKDAYAEFRRSGAPLEVEMLGPGWWRLLFAILVAEGAVILYFALAQREVTIEVEAETGAARIFQRRRLRGRTLIDLAFSDVEAFEVELKVPDTRDEYGSASAYVVASMKSVERRKLFEAMRGDAQRAADHLTQGLDAWNDAVRRGEQAPGR